MRRNNYFVNVQIATTEQTELDRIVLYVGREQTPTTKTTRCDNYTLNSVQKNESTLNWTNGDRRGQTNHLTMRTLRTSSASLAEMSASP